LEDDRPKNIGFLSFGAWHPLTIGGLLTLDTCVAQFFAGPHEAFFAGGIDNLVCVALAEG
jgi:hypothetical protein